MPKSFRCTTSHFVIRYFRRLLYGSKLIRANLPDEESTPIRFESVQALSRALTQALATEQLSGLNKLTNRGHWGDTGVVQMMYLGQACEVVDNILKNADHSMPGSVDKLAKQLNEELQRLESNARNGASDIDGFATASIRRVRSTLFAQSQPRASWASNAWRRLISFFD